MSSILIRLCVSPHSSTLFLLPCHSFLLLLHVFSPLFSQGGLLGATVRCSVKEGVVEEDTGMKGISCTQTILGLIPGAGPSRSCSPVVPGISPDKQLKEL